MKVIYTLLLVILSSFLFAQTWKQTNGPFGGNVRCFAMNSNEEIFAGTAGGGIFRSSDNGNSWTSVNNGLTGMDVWALTVTQDDQIFAGTSSGGVFRSTDN